MATEAELARWRKAVGSEEGVPSWRVRWVEGRKARYDWFYCAQVERGLRDL